MALYGLWNQARWGVVLISVSGVFSLCAPPPSVGPLIPYNSSSASLSLRLPMAQSSFGGFPALPSSPSKRSGVYVQTPPSVRKSVSSASPRSQISWGPASVAKSPGPLIPRAHSMVAPLPLPQNPASVISQPVSSPWLTYSEESNGVDAAREQQYRNAIAALERQFMTMDSSDYVVAVKPWLDRFNDLDDQSRVRLMLMVQSFLSNAQNSAHSKGVVFEKNVAALKKQFLEVLPEDEFPRYESAATYQSSIVGIKSNLLYQTYVEERRACHALVNLWRSYTTAADMTGKYYEDLLAALDPEEEDGSTRALLLPGKSYCLAASLLVNRVLDGLVEFDKRVRSSGDGIVTKLDPEKVTDYIERLTELQKYYALVLAKGSEVFSAAAVKERLQRISKTLTSIQEKGNAENPNPSYAISERLALVYDVEELLLRGGPMIPSGHLAQLIDRVLSLHAAGITAPHYGAFFLATVDLLFFVDCFVLDQPEGASGLISERMEKVANKLKEQYRAWHEAMNQSLSSLSSEFVWGKCEEPVCDMYSKKPSAYSDREDGKRRVAIDRLLACMPFVTRGMGEDAKDHKGLRVERSSDAPDLDSDRLVYANPLDFVAASQGWYADSATPRPQMIIDAKKAQPGTFRAPQTKEEPDLAGYTTAALKKISKGLYDEAIQEMVHLNAPLKPYGYGQAAFSIAIAWLRDMVIIDEMLARKGEKPKHHEVEQKWGFVADQLSNFMSIFSALPAVKVKFDAQRSIGLLLGDFARTHAYDLLSPDLRERLWRMFRKSSQRTKADPTFVSNLTFVDGLDVVARIKASLAQSVHKQLRQKIRWEGTTDKLVRLTKAASAIATLAALFDKDRAIEAQGLFGNDTKHLLVDVIMKAGVSYGSVEYLVKKVPKVGVKGAVLGNYTTQTLKMWDIFLDKFFSSEAQQTAFWKVFKDKGSKITNKLKTAQKDLEQRRKNIKAEILKRGGVAGVKPVPPFSFSIRLSSDLKVGVSDLNLAYKRFFESKPLKDLIVALELRLMDKLKCSPVFLYDKSFWLPEPASVSSISKINTLREAYEKARDYVLPRELSLGVFDGSKTKAAMTILRGIIMLLQKDVFKQKMGYSIAQHFVVALNEVAKQCEKELTDRDLIGDETSSLRRLFYAAYVMLLQVLPDVAAVMSATNDVWAKLQAFYAENEDAAALVDGVDKNNTSIKELVMSPTK